MMFLLLAMFPTVLVTLALIAVHVWATLLPAITVEADDGMGNDGWALALQRELDAPSDLVGTALLSWELDYIFGAAPASVGAPKRTRSKRKVKVAHAEPVSATVRCVAHTYTPRVAAYMCAVC